MPAETSEPSRVPITLRKDLYDRLALLRELVRLNIQDEGMRNEMLAKLDTGRIVDQSTEAYLDVFITRVADLLPE